MTTIDDLRAELARERAAHAATRQVLEDAARDRGGVVVLDMAALFAVIDALGSDMPCCDGCDPAGERGDVLIGKRWHSTDCVFVRAIHALDVIDNSPRDAPTDTNNGLDGAAPSPGRLAKPE